MFQKVLLPLDGSTFAEFALPYAAEIARRAGAAVEVVTVHDPIPGFALGEPQRKARIGQERYLASVGEDLGAYTGGPVSHSVATGDPAEALLSHAEETAPDLVVMTTHGRGPLSRLWLGSVADHLIRHSPRPILLVGPTEEAPPEAGEIALGRILVPLDGSALAEGILAPVLELADLFDSDLALIRVVPLPPLERSGAPAHAVDREIREERRDEARSYLESVAERLRGQGRSVEIDTRVDHPASGIQKAAREREADFVALATRGQGGIRRALLGSVADKVIRSTKLPKLVYPSSAES